MTAYDVGELDHDGIVIAISDQERRVLARVADRLGVEWRSDGRARIYSRGYVGRVSLSEETSVQVSTKMPVANILRLASLAYRTLPIPAAVGDTHLQTDHPAMDWLVVLIITQIDALLRRGLRQDYVNVEDELPYVRGRLRFDAALSWARPDLTACAFADFLPDTPENQLLRSTLEVLLTRRLLPGLRARAAQLLRSFIGVSFVRPSRKLLTACRITHLNQQYGPAIDLCRLFLEGAGLELESGEQSAPAFFFPMEMVFQEAVTSLLDERLPVVTRQHGRTYQPLHGAADHSLTYAADIVLGKPPSLVIDTKYANAEVRNRFGGRSFRNDNVYQASFYGLSLRCPVMLVYPRAERDIDVTFEVEDVRVSILTIDLKEPGLPALDALVARVAELGGLLVAA
jgi:5-methylcytosine-specific restriction enzyme subunit McrC